MAGGNIRGGSGQQLATLYDATTRAMLLEFDVVISDNQSRETKGTEWPVQRKSAMTDFIIPGLKTIDLKVIFTSTPADDSNAGEDVAYQIALLAGQPAAGATAVENAVEPSTSPFRDFDKVETLDRIQQARQPIILSTNAYTFGPCYIAGVKTRRDSAMGLAIECSVTLRELRLVDSAYVSLPPRRFAFRAGDAWAMTRDGGSATPTASAPGAAAAATAANPP